MDDLHDRQGAVLQLLPALSPDLAGSAADRRPHHALRQAGHGAAADVRSPKSARSPSGILPPARRFDAIGETCYRSWTMTVGEARAAGRRAGRPARGRQGAAAGQEGRTADRRQCRARPDDQAVRACASCRTRCFTARRSARLRLYFPSSIERRRAASTASATSLRQPVARPSVPRARRPSCRWGWSPAGAASPGSSPLSAASEAAP